MLTSHSRKKKRDRGSLDSQGAEPATPGSASASCKEELEFADGQPGNGRRLDGGINLKSVESMDFYESIFGEKYGKDFGAATQ